jgi:DUF4097 and DUF4098 domain-containing protein YvlB
MPDYETPEPISVNVELGVGNVRITASDRTDTIVAVRPSDENDESDVKAVEQVRVDYAGGVLRISGPKRNFDFSKKTKSVDVSIELPSDSAVSAHMQLGDLRSAGRLGECTVKTTGDVWLERTGPLRLHTGFGQVTADAVVGNADVSTGSGKVAIGEAMGSVVVKNSNGDTTIGAATGDVRVRNANGLIEVARAGAGVDVKTSNGAVRLGEVARGSVVFATAAGNVDIGIAEGTAAWLQVNTGFGHVDNQMESATRPGEADATVEVRGRTGYGDITIHRS